MVCYLIYLELADCGNAIAPWNIAQAIADCGPCLRMIADFEKHISDCGLRPLLVDDCGF